MKVESIVTVVIAIGSQVRWRLYSLLSKFLVMNKTNK